MRLANLNEYRQLFYTPDSAPSIRTLREKIRSQKLAGGVLVDGRYYVDLDQAEHAMRLGESLRARKAELERSPALEGLI
jgi:hypothetical protein